MRNTPCVRALDRSQNIKCAAEVSWELALCPERTAVTHSRDAARCSLLPALLHLTVTALVLLVPQPSKAQNQSRTEATFRTEAGRVLVPVTVRDRAGVPVGTLERQHFRIYEDGKPQPITEFSVETPSSRLRPGTAPGSPNDAIADSPAAPPRLLAYIFDDRNISLQDLEYARTAFEKHLDAGLDPNTRAAVVTTSGSLVTPFVSDRAVLVEAARRIKPGGATQTGMGCPEISYFMADLIINKKDFSALNAAFQQMLRCGPPMPPSIGHAIVKVEAERILRVEREQTLATLKLLETALVNMAAFRARNEVIILSTGFTVLSERIELERLLNRALELRITISAINVHGVHAGRFDASRHSPSPSYVERSLQSRSDTLANLAETTGGRYITNTNAIRDGLQTLAEEPQFTYLLAFVPKDLQQGRQYRKLRVEVVGTKDLVVQARRGYFSRTTANATDTRQVIREAMMSPTDIDEIGLSVVTTYQMERRALTVLARVGGPGIEFAECGDRTCNALTVVYGLFRGDGTYVSETTRKAELRLDASALKRFRGEGIQLAAEFKVPQGPYTARVVVVDQNGRIAAVSRPLSGSEK